MDERSVDDLLSFINGENGGIYEKYSLIFLICIRIEAFNLQFVELLVL